ncbi:aspartate kinase [Nemorincola caseinilytica]|uniref:Aspartokinase n=1 Tax=Nemorincola caseinilytica TaxID=2054315 RepID=A0ABP8N8F4_9BACT
MKVYKFGGASIADAGRMTALLPIVQNENEPLLIVMSALGKTTNALENILAHACKGDMKAAQALADTLIDQHMTYALALLDDMHFEMAKKALATLANELKKAVGDADAAFYDQSYDQVVCMGELLSTCMFHHFLLQNGMDAEWVDVRKVIRTDDTYRDAAIDWNYTKLEAEAIIGRKLRQGKIVVVQGFIGSTEAGASVTLGREGSDYTAAVLAAMLRASSVTIWKDVDGFRNADPKLFADTVKIEAISYNEVIEMAFYGAQIIHPKTIKPLHNNNIPLYVKCFLDKELSGSVIKGDTGNVAYPPLIVLKDKQVLVQVTTRDFSFITEDNLSRIYAIFHELKVKINLIQNAAISFVACIDDREDKIKALLVALGKDYKVSINESVSLLTVRHYTPEIFFGLTKDKQILLRQETRKTLQAVMK